jgi:hypothetical protein
MHQVVMLCDSAANNYKVWGNEHRNPSASARRTQLPSELTGFLGQHRKFLNKQFENESIALLIE